MKKIGNKGSIIVTALIGIPASFFMVVSTAALISLNSARMKANDASFQSHAASALQSMVLCCDTVGGAIQDMNTYAPNSNMCSPDEMGDWPDTFSSVTVINQCNSNLEFEVEFTPSNNINTNISKAICTQNGCEFE